MALSPPEPPLPLVHRAGFVSGSAPGEVAPQQAIRIFCSLATHSGVVIEEEGSSLICWRPHLDLRGGDQWDPVPTLMVFLPLDATTKVAACALVFF